VNTIDLPLLLCYKLVDL